MAHLTITDIERNMVDSAAAGVEYKVTRTHLARGDRLSASRLRAGVVRQGYTEFRHDRHRKSRAVRSVCQARSAIDISVSDELNCVVCNLGTFGGNTSGLRSGSPVVCAVFLAAVLLTGIILRVVL